MYKQISSKQDMRGYFSIEFHFRVLLEYLISILDPLVMLYNKLCLASDQRLKSEVVRNRSQFICLLNSDSGTYAVV